MAVWVHQGNEEQAASSACPLLERGGSAVSTTSAPQGVWGWEGTRDIKAELVGPYRRAKGWYSGGCNSVNAYLDSLKKARIT